ncbi:MAG: PEP/pyruvate-binding domain-containing protein [Thermoanaerobaculia bacterium]
MRSISDDDVLGNIARFDRAFLDPRQRFKHIGAGKLGGKALGLAFAHSALASLPPDAFPGIDISIPSLTVLRTDLFDAFVRRSELTELALDDLSDEAIAIAFQKGELPTEILGDLRALVEQVKTPLAVRSSSLLEDALDTPFAGIYETKMIPNNQPSADERFRRLVEAIKFVWASTWFRGARAYVRATTHTSADERMAVIIQEVVGRRFQDRWYPHVSGVARSYNYYALGRVRPEDGVCNLALGLGKTIVDGGLSWIYSPAYPANPPPFNSPGDLLEQTQTEFWAVNLGKPPAWDPIRETEYLVQCGLAEAETDGALRLVASTFDTGRGRISPGIGATGPRVLDFAMLLVLRELPLNDIVRSMLAICSEAFSSPVEIEFAMSLDPPRFGLLQVRPMAVSRETVTIADDEMDAPEVVVASDRVLGNGECAEIRHIVYVKPETFEAKKTALVAAEIDAINRRLVDAGEPYLLIGPGRWGSADPWLGIQVGWEQIAGAHVIVEAMLPSMNVELSQGSHFFHNLTSFQVLYFSVPSENARPIAWEWLERQQAVEETELVRHVVLREALDIRVDGRTGRGFVRTGAGGTKVSDAGS